VSIKKKFVTAVTTAGLLAGLFGSAFVPGAAAASVKASYTEVYQGSEIAPFANDSDYNLGRTIGFQSADSSVEDGTAEFTSVQIALFETTEKAVNAQDTGDGGAIDGKRYGAEPYDPDRLVATSSNAGILVSWAVDADGIAADCDDADLAPSVSPRGVLLGGTFGASDTLYDANGVGEYADEITRGYIDADGDFSELDADDVGGDDTTDAFELCLTALNNDTAATSTVTVKADGTTVATLTVTAVGPADSIVLALAGSKYIAADNDSVEDFLSIQVKDENGTVLNGKDSSVSEQTVDDLFINGVMDWDGNPETANDTVVNLLDTDGTPTAQVDGGTYPYLFDIDATVCLGDEDEEMVGTSYSVKVMSDDEDIVSNSITITCTEDGEDARVTKVTPEALSGGKEYEETGELDDGDLSLIATVVAGNGGPLGEGSGVACDDFEWDTVVYTTEDLDDTIAGTDEVVDGECEIGYLEPGVVDELPRFGKFTYTLTALNPDLGEVDEDEVDFVLSYSATGTVDTVTIARVRNAAKTVATITFDGGEGAAFESVYFQVEKANGAVAEFRRRANGDGVARLVLSRRNTVLYVYAFSETSDESDTIKVRFR
jgi:hypothetical protein